MAIGKKTGGRLRGTPNRRTQDVELLLSRIGCDPIEGMARIAMDSQTPVEVRARMFAELACYIAPKRKAIDLGGSDQERVIFNIGIEPRHAPKFYIHEPSKVIDPTIGGTATARIFE